MILLNRDFDHLIPPAAVLDRGQVALTHFVLEQVHPWVAGCAGAMSGVMPGNAAVPSTDAAYQGGYAAGMTEMKCGLRAAGARPRRRGQCAS